MLSRRYLILINLFYVLGIGLNIVLLRFLSQHIEPLNNNGIRFLAGGIVLSLFAIWQYPTQLRLLLTQPKNILMSILIGLMLAANMYFWLKGTQLTNAVTASLFGVLAMPFSVLIAALFYPDERQKTRDKGFWLGSALTILGALGFIWYGNSLTIGEGFMLGALFLFLSICIRNTQNLIVKSARSVSMFAFSCFTSFSASFSSLFLSMQNSTLSELHSLPVWLIVLLIAAGIYAVFAAMALAFNIIQQQGLITYQVLELLIPVTTAIAAYFILGEAIHFIQLVFAIIVIIGASCALGIIKVSRHKVAASAKSA